MPKVLIVDDEPQYGVYLRDWLAREGHEVRTATTAQDAIDFASRWVPNVLVADWALQSPLDGLHVSAAVRAVNPSLQTILITGYPSTDLKARARDAHVFSLIEKPFSLSEVAGAVRRAASAGLPQFHGTVMVVSDLATVGQTICEALQGAGHTACLALSAVEAHRVAQREASLAVVVLDCVTPSPDVGLLAEELRAIRPELIVVGSSEGDDQATFAAMGVEHFLPRFWEPHQLAALLVMRIDSCENCGLPLPLRRPLPGDSATDWECSMCGSRYRGVMMPDAPDDTRRHVLPAARRD